jgi:hypothetical protein
MTGSFAGMTGSFAGMTGSFAGMTGSFAGMTGSFAGMTTAGPTVTVNRRTCFVSDPWSGSLAIRIGVMGDGDRSARRPEIGLRFRLTEHVCVARPDCKFVQKSANTGMRERQKSDWGVSAATSNTFSRHFRHSTLSQAAFVSYFDRLDPWFVRAVRCRCGRRLFEQDSASTRQGIDCRRHSCEKRS